MARTFARPAGRVDYVRNQSSRRGVKPTLIVLHTTESHERPGRGDVDSIHAWFDNPESQASSHVIVDEEAHTTTCVGDLEKAWTQARFNPCALSIEMIGWASTPRWRWLKRERQLKKAAKFAAYWCRKYGIPVQRAVVSQTSATVVKPGITGHASLGAAGGGHHDPGEGFPWDRFLRYVKYYRANGWVQ